MLSVDLAAYDEELPPLAEHQPVEWRCAAPPGGWLELAVDGQAVEPFLRPGSPEWRWRWNPGAAVGLHRLALTSAEGQRRWSLRVEPRKIDQQRYEALLEDVQRRAYNIVYTLSGTALEGAALEREAPWRRSRLEEYYALFEEQLDSLAAAVRRIAARPSEQLRGRADEAPLGRAAALDAEALAHLASGPLDEVPPHVAAELQEAIRPGGGLLPRAVPGRRGAPTTDIYEHRLLKQLLTTLLRRARFIGALAEREAARIEASQALVGAGGTRLARARQIAEGCAGAARLLRELRGMPFLAEVGPLAAFRGATPLLQRDPNYRAVLRAWQALRGHPYAAFDSPLLSLPITELPFLYEAWCALQVAESLLALGGSVREQRLVAERREGDDADLAHVVALVEQTPLLVLERGDATLALRYQARYRPLGSGMAGLGSLDRHTRVPDLAIELRRAGQPARVLVLDAKYRQDADGRGVPQDALADGYAYLGAIGDAGGRATLGAALLYPGSGPAEHFPSGVSAIPLLPSQTEALAAWLGEHLGREE